MISEIRTPCIFYNKFIILLLLIIAQISKAEDEVKKNGNKKIILNAKIYSNIFARIRVEHKFFVKRLLSKDYESRYKMLELAFQKFLQLMKETNATLIQSGYSPKSGFPKDEELHDPVTHLLENTCLAGDVLLHMPDISYRILKNLPSSSDWRETFTWAIDFVNEFPHIIDVETGKMLDTFRLEINESLRPDDYKNPYKKTEDENVTNETKSGKKKKKRLKNGPQLVGRNEL